MLIWAALCIALIGAGIFVRMLRARNVDLIVRHHLTSPKRPVHEGTRHIFFCVTDHYEPFWHRADKDLALERVLRWWTQYPAAVDGFRDGGGRVPQHGFFYPAEEYDAECVARIADLQRRGYGSVEIHLHHDRDSSERFREKILTFKNQLHRDHGLLHQNPATGGIEYAFIHGMYALDDSGPRGRWCGVKNEITILKETGCYADFTFPSAPAPTQPPMLNRIYYATDDPTRAKSHHKGVDAEFGKPPSGDLLLVTGPLAINWRQRRRKIFPALETSELSGGNPPTRDRVDLWVRTGITLKGWPRWIFVKIHTHGTQEKVSAMLFQNGLSSMYSYLSTQYNDGRRYVLHFVQPREVYYCIKALEFADASWISRIEAFDYAPPTTARL